MVFNVRTVLASVLFSLAVVPALAQTDIQCNDSGITGDCTQFIAKFCADVASVKVEGYTDVSRCYNASGFTSNQGDSENGLQSPQLMAIGHTRYDGTAISQVKSQRNICDHEASSDSQFTMELTIGYNLVSYSNLS